MWLKRIGVGVACVCVLLLFYWFVPVFDGESAAEADIRVGQLKILLIGKPRPDHRIWARIVKDRFGVTLELLGCVETFWEEHFHKEYNARMMKEINRRFGNTAWVKASDDATAEYLGKQRK